MDTSKAARLLELHMTGLLRDGELAELLGNTASPPDVAV